VETTQRIVGSGRGKLILFGEHSVVYGQPAIVASLSRGANAWVSLDSSQSIKIVDGMSGETFAEVAPDPEGDGLQRAFHVMLEVFEVHAPARVVANMNIPIGAGLGSSAALAAAVARALAEFVSSPTDRERIERAVSLSENVFHGKASGIDQAAALGGGVFLYQTRGEGKAIQQLQVKPVRVAVCLADKPASTADEVGRVADLHERHPKRTSQIDDVIGNISRDAAKALIDGDWETVGELMNFNQGLLYALGCSTGPIEEACFVARDAGALGAKLTGAGGGGCVFALAPDNADAIVEAWRAGGWTAFSVDIP
jgi:mevalonate kinase